MSVHTFTPTDRGYSSWFYDPPCGDALTNPLKEKLLVGDNITSSGEIDRCSRYRTEKSIPGVLCLSRGTHGRRKGRQLYRCIPADPSLPVFLVPYSQKKPEFGKAPIDLYILFEFVEWIDKHPVGSSTNTLGKVSDLDTTYSYLTHARGLHHPIQKLTRHVFNAIRSHPDGVDGLERELEETLPPAQPEEWGDLITIDPEGATDLDDALSAVKLPGDNNGFRVSICITDPTYWLERLGLWRMMTNKTTTLYLPNAKRPMLPPNLSEGLCSLLAGKPRAALILWLRIGNDGAVIESGFLGGSVRIKHNYVYEDAAMKSCTTYAALREATDLAQKADPLLDDILDSHDVVAYWMMKYNIQAAEALSQAKLGIYRAAPEPRLPDAGASAPRSQLPDDTQRLLRYWGAGAGSYTNWKDRAPHGGIADGTKLYVQATSPIRRICDLVNTTCLIQACNLRTLPQWWSAESVTFANRWSGNIDDIQRAGRAARKLQAECELLDHCIRVKESALQGDPAPEYDGYPIEKQDRPAYSTFCFRYTVHIPFLHNLVKVDTDEEWSLLECRRFTLHLFVEESTLCRKVRVAPST